MNPTLFFLSVVCAIYLAVVALAMPRDAKTALLSASGILFILALALSAVTAIKEVFL